MERDDRKKLTANELYLNECMTILYTKIKSLGFNFFNKDGKLLSNNIFNIENYRHGTITCMYSPNSIKVNYDGTNFNPIFVENSQGGFLYKLKPLGIEYICSDRKLDEKIHEKRIVRKVGNSADYYRYLSSENFFLLLEHWSKDSEGITAVNNVVANSYNDDELINYMQEKVSFAEELESEFIDDDEIELCDEIEKEDIENCEDSYRVPNSEFSIKEQEEIDAYSSDEDYEDIYVIDYSLSDLLEDDALETPYYAEYPQNIEDFDYESYIKNINKAESENINIIEDDNYEKDIDEDDYIEGCKEFEYEEEELYGATDSLMTDDDFIEDKCFQVVQNGILIDDERKTDIVDIAIESIMDVDQEVTTLADYYNDIKSEVKKMRAIMLKRKEHIVNKKAGQTEYKTSECKKRNDTEIENR